MTIKEFNTTKKFKTTKSGVNKKSHIKISVMSPQWSNTYNYRELNTCTVSDYVTLSAQIKNSHAYLRKRT